MKLPVIQHEPVHVRHVKKGTSTDPGARQVLGHWFTPQPLEGVNGPQGFVSGKYGLRINEDGSFLLRFANDVGGDGKPHRSRFLILPGNPSDYRVGDEWVEIYRGGELAFVGSPVDYSVDLSAVEISGGDALWLLKHERETTAAFWQGNAPRDVVEHYTQAWDWPVAEDFTFQTFTHSMSEQSTPDGAWKYLRGESVAEETYCRLRPAAASVPAYVVGLTPFDPAVGKRWRAEAEIAIASFGQQSAGARHTISFGLESTAGVPATHIKIEGTANTVLVDVSGFVEAGTPDNTASLLTGVASNGTWHLAIEADARWIYLYVNGQLKAVLPVFSLATFPALVPALRIEAGVVNDGVTITARHISVRAHTPFLMRGADKGDRRLPGELPDGGLIGAYYDEVGTGAGTAFSLLPTSDPVGRREDPEIDFATGYASGMGVLNPQYSSVRWTGAVYLDLAAYDFRLQMAVKQGAARVWVGKTMWGEEILTGSQDGATGSAATVFTSAYLRSLLGTISGWYPVVIEFASIYSPSYSSQRITVQAERSDAPGVWKDLGTESATVGVKTSPAGCFEGRLRFVSHFEQLKTMLDSYALQATCSPRQLESGEFPGQVIPRMRIGRDTEEVVTLESAAGMSVKGSAEDTVDSLYADAAGISDPLSGSQVTGERTNYQAVGEHLIVHQEVESLSDISITALVHQRLDSMLALRSAPWEEVSAQPLKKRDLSDTFPLTGAMAKFKWDPGDAARLDVPEIGVRDNTPRQFVTVEWPFVPDGLGAPAVAWRQRPRDFREALLRLQRTVLSATRNYQGQLTTVTGNVGQTPPPASGGSGANYSSVNLPADLTKVVKAELVVQTKSDGSTMDLEVNGTNRATFTTTGRYEITAWVASYLGGPVMVARGTGGTGTATYALELLVAV